MRKVNDFLFWLSIRNYRRILYPAKTLVVMIIALCFHSHVFAAATCLADQRMYYVGAATPSTAYRSLPLSGWVEGSLTRTYTFSEATGNKTLTINFPLFLDKYTTYTSQPPYYGTLNGATLNAITMIHNSTSTKENHVMDVTVNKPVAKLGYVIQDVDSARNGTNNVPYQEAVDVSSTAGTLTHQPDFHTINLSLDIATSILRVACSGTSTSYACPIEATWGPKAANSPFSMTHSNQRSDYNAGHVLGYSDFYFCLAPPKLTVKKALSGTRVNSNDQFEIVVSGGSVAANSFTTTGTGSTVTDGTSTTLSLTEGTNYTITERVMNGTTLGDIANYNATYACTNTTTGSTTVMPSAAMSYNANTKTRSFTLTNTVYGDEITCTITNEPNYLFSGIVFGDNGGIVASDSKRLDISSTFTGNSSYFNGIYDSSSELGLYDSNLTIRLTDCKGNDVTSTTPNPQNVSNTATTKGQYSFIVPVSALVNTTRVCLIESEPNIWDYPVDTTTDNREVTLLNNVYNYNNLNFGEVAENNAALVLIKSQYIHECNDNLDYQAINDSTDPTTGFSMNTVNDASPGSCVAYAIRAYNRGHLGLQQIQIRDQLQSVPVTSVFRRPTPLFSPSSVTSPTVTYGSNGEIRSNQFNLSAVPLGSTQPSSAVLYFNTRYGSTQ